MKKHFLSFILLALTLGFSANAWAGTWENFTQGTTIYVDLSEISNCSSEKVAKIPSSTTDNSTTEVQNICGTITSITFQKDVHWETEAQWFIQVKIGNQWVDGIKYKSRGSYNCAKVSSDGKSYTWTTYTPTPPSDCTNCKTITK